MSDAPRDRIPALLREQLALDELSDRRLRSLEEEFGVEYVQSARAQLSLAPPGLDCRRCGGDARTRFPVHCGLLRDAALLERREGRQRCCSFAAPAKGLKCDASRAFRVASSSGVAVESSINNFSHNSSI